MYIDETRKEPLWCCFRMSKTFRFLSHPQKEQWFFYSNHIVTLQTIFLDGCLHMSNPTYHILRFSELHQMCSQVENRHRNKWIERMSANPPKIACGMVASCLCKSFVPPNHLIKTQLIGRIDGGEQYPRMHHLR